MVNKSKDVGTRGESAVVTYAKNEGFPHADRLTLSGAQDRGDVRLTRELRNGIVVEVKAGHAAEQAGDLKVDAWMAETEAERQAAGAALGVLVVKRAGYGPNRCGRWWAVLPASFLSMLIETADSGDPRRAPSAWTTMGGGWDSAPVRIHLDALMPLLVTVYGED